MYKYISFVYEDFPVFSVYCKFFCSLTCFSSLCQVFFPATWSHISLRIPLLLFIQDLNSHILLTWDFSSSLQMSSPSIFLMKCKMCSMFRSCLIVWLGTYIVFYGYKFHSLQVNTSFQLHFPLLSQFFLTQDPSFQS